MSSLFEKDASYYTQFFDQVHQIVERSPWPAVYTALIAGSFVGMLFPGFTSTLLIAVFGFDLIVTLHSERRDKDDVLLMSGIVLLILIVFQRSNR